MSRLALVRRPSSRLTEGIVTHIERSPLDLDLAARQWQDYVDVLQAYGWETVEVPPADDCPDSVFIEDAMVVFRGVALIARPGADRRRPETADAHAVVAALGYRCITVEAPGTLDGGDILKVDSTIYVGLSERTNAAGIAQLAAAFEPLGAAVITVPLSNVLHLKSAVTALPDGTIIGWEPVVDDPAVFPKFLAMPEENGAHVVLLSETDLLIQADAVDSIALLRDLGYTPVPVDIGEFIKLEGCVTCLSVRLRDVPGR